MATETQQVLNEDQLRDDLATAFDNASCGLYMNLEDALTEQMIRQKVLNEPDGVEPSATAAFTTRGDGSILSEQAVAALQPVVTVVGGILKLLRQQDSSEIPIGSSVLETLLSQAHEEVAIAEFEADLSGALIQQIMNDEQYLSQAEAIEHLEELDTALGKLIEKYSA